MYISKERMFKLVGAKVAYYRKLRNLTQEELGKRTHTSRSCISRVEQGRYNHDIPLSTLIDIANGLNIDVSVLVSVTEEEKHLYGNENRSSNMFDSPTDI